VIVVVTDHCAASGDVLLLLCMLLCRPDAAAYDVPDRQTGRQGLAELQTLNSRRQWNFVEVATATATAS